MTAETSSRCAPTQVRWATGRTGVPASRVDTTWRAVARSPPPAPYVTDTKSGRAATSRRAVSQNVGAASGRRGGMSSNETVGRAGNAG